MIKKIISFVAVFTVCAPAVALTPAAGRGRQTAANQVMAAPRAIATVPQTNSVSAPVMVVANVADASATAASGQVTGTATAAPVVTVTNEATGSVPVSAAQPVSVHKPATEVKDTREKERAACTMNNIGVGNTFVWASRYSNLNNYASMVEDIDEPANNTCFVRVEIRSDDAKINVSDIPVKYFEMGQTITCGAWADEKVLEKRILDAKKNARTWATVGGAVGGAALGVGAMELFGNGLIGGKVEGQKGLNKADQLASQIKVLKKKKDGTLDKIRTELQILKAECDSKIWEGEKPQDVKEACDAYQYDRLLTIIEG